MNNFISERELDVLRLLVKGKENKEIASALGIGVRTVQTHRERMNRRFRTRSGIELVVYGLTNGIITLPTCSSSVIQRKPRPSKDQLTERELEIVKLVALGKSAEVCRKLKVGARGVDSHRGNINRKLHVSRTGPLVLYALRQGWIPLFEFGKKTLNEFGFSGREREVLLHYGSGYEQKEVAAKIGISYRTVADHIENIIKKIEPSDLQIPPVVIIVHFACRYGLVSLVPSNLNWEI